MLICPEASSAQNNIAAVSADGSTVCVLIRRLNSSCRRSIAFVVRALRHCVDGRRVKVKRRAPASSRQPPTGRGRNRPLPMNPLPRALQFFPVRPPHHPVLYAVHPPPHHPPRHGDEGPAPL